MKRVLVTGASGMLGTDVVKVFSEGYHVSALSRRDLDITNPQDVKHAMESLSPEIVINCAAFTKVDDCESRPETAFEVNSAGPKLLAHECRALNALLVHISSDYVFDGSGKRPYREDDKPCPINVYGRSKLNGETFVREILTDHLIVRTSWLFGPNGPNFIDTVIRLSATRKELRVVNDQYGSPTYTMDLAKGLRCLVEKGARGLCHCTNIGSCTWFDLCKFVFNRMGISDICLVPVPTRSFPRPAKRPAFSVLDNTRFQQLTGRKMRFWQEAVLEFLVNRDPNSIGSKAQDE